VTRPGELTDVGVGTVHEARGGVYSVVLDDGVRVEASLRGRLKRERRTGSRVVIGDRVHVSAAGGGWTIESVEERVTELVRRGRGGRAPKILAANLDRVFTVVALRAPGATVRLVDRLLVLVESGGMHPMLVLNKMDLEGAPEIANDLTRLYEAVGYPVFRTSAETGEGLDALHDEICSGFSALIGPSGVGKSSLLNALDPELTLRTRSLSRKTGTGRHTTVGSQIVAMKCGGLVADTPGFGDIGLWAVRPDAVAEGFPEFAEHADDCSFRGCTHLREPGCGVRAALDSGRIFASRHASYVTLRAEAEEAAAR